MDPVGPLAESGQTTLLPWQDWGILKYPLISVTIRIVDSLSCQEIHTMATSAPSSPIDPPRPRQNWVIGPVPDYLLIVVAPILGLIWGVATFKLFGGGLNGQVAVIGIFMIFNVAHHFPTFIRIYGDADLMKRFRWSLLLAPIIPFTASILLCSYLVLRGFPIQYIVYLSIILTIWDPWHFLMQHYGFMRIYDRHNRAPRKIAARMDYWLCATWFIFCMISATGWLPNLIYDFNDFFGVPLLFLFNSSIYGLMLTTSLVAALAMTLVYAYYLYWCRKNGFYISTVKLLLVLVTFSIMYLTFAPNALMEKWVPAWTFSMGFAAIGMVHVSQYLAIVWKYNRGLARREGASRSPFFTRLFKSRGGTLTTVMIGYVLVCLIYGSLLTNYGKSFWFPYLGLNEGGFTTGLLIVLGSTVFTSTLLHYYYDGFIWKLRHKENRQHLDLVEGQEEAQKEDSWWKRSDTSSAGTVLAWQSLYFLVPMALLSGLFWLSISPPQERDPILGMQISQLEQGSALTFQQRRRLGEESIQRAGKQLEIEQQMVTIRPRAVNHFKIANLLYERAQCQFYWDRIEQGISPDLPPRPADLVRMNPPLSGALEHYQRALTLPPPYGQVDRRDVEQRMSFIKQIQRMMTNR